MSDDPNRQAFHEMIYTLPANYPGIAIYQDSRGHWVARYPTDTPDAVSAEIRQTVDRLNHARQS